MKTRIISGVIMALLVAGILALGFMWESIIITIAVSLLALIAVYELLSNAAGIKEAQVLIGACLFAFMISAVNYITQNFVERNYFR